MAVTDYSNILKKTRTRICVIDIGTNSFHAIIVEVRSDGTYKAIDRIKEMVMLGEGGMSDHMLTNAAQQRGRDTMNRIRHWAEGWGATQFRAYATSAVREAKNGGTFIEKVKQESGIFIRAISGSHEANLIWRAVNTAIDLDEPALLVDIGGGSTEFIVVKDGEVKHLCSLKLGAARLSEVCVTTDPISKVELDQLKMCCRIELSFVFEAARRLGVKRMIGSSGTITNLATICASMLGTEEETVWNQVFGAKEFDTVLNRILKSDEPERKLIVGLDPKRLNQIVAGAALVQVLLDDLKLKTIEISADALREGIVLEFIEENGQTFEQLAGVKGIRRRSVYEIAYHFDWEKPHTLQVTNLSLQLFDALAQLHKYGKKERDLLEYASILHDIGLFISESKHHKHSLYLISEADLHGFKNHEIQIMANVARYHRGAEPSDKHPAYVALSTENKKTVQVLSAILRIGNGLDRSHFQNVQKLDIKIGKKKIQLNIETKADPQLEIWGADRHKDLFESVFDRKLKIVASSLLPEPSFAELA